MSRDHVRDRESRADRDAAGDDLVPVTLDDTTDLDLVVGAGSERVVAECVERHGAGVIARRAQLDRSVVGVRLALDVLVAPAGDSAV